MKSFIRSSLGVAAVSLSLITSLAAADRSAVPHGDKAFLEKASKAGAEEVAISQAALPHLTNSQAREFAQMMIADHSKANEELAALAGRKNVALPTKQPDIKKWAAGKDRDFDKDYIEKMAKDHDDAVDLFAKAAKKSDDPDVQAFATKTLPTLEHHLQMAKDIKKMTK